MHRAGFGRAEARSMDTVLRGAHFAVSGNRCLSATAKAFGAARPSTLCSAKRSKSSAKFCSTCRADRRWAAQRRPAGAQTDSRLRC